MSNSTPGRPSYLWLCVILLAGLLFSLPAQGLSPQPDTAFQGTTTGEGSAEAQVLIPATPAGGDLVEVIVTLHAQPLHDAASEVQAAYTPTLDRIRQELQVAYGAPLLLRGKWTADSPATARAERARHKSAELQAALQAMRQEIINRARPQAEASQTGLVQWLESNGAVVHTRLVVINAIAATVPRSQLDALRARPDVAEVAENRQMTAQLGDSPYAIDADTWWDAGYTGGVWVPAILDTSVRKAHDALDHVAWSDQVCLDTAKAANDPDPSDVTSADVNGHGTHMAGIVVSNYYDYPTLYRGIARDTAEALNLKAAYDLDGVDGGPAMMYWSDMMDCADWALTHSGGGDPHADVFNLGYTACVTETQDDSPAARFWDAVVDDWLVPAAIPAGNYTDGITCTRYVGDPGIAYNVITVGNVDDTGDASSSSPNRDDDTINPTSAWGKTPGGRKKPDLSAPGTNIRSTDNNSDTAFSNVTGTSAAAAHVTGAILLLQEYGITDPREQKALLINTAEDKGASGWDKEYGWGYIDLGEAWSHKDDTLLDNISPTPDFQFYQGGWDAEDRATLVWNRQVAYNNEITPTTVYPLNNLDLYVYSEDDNTLLGSDTSAMDNVHVVTSTVNPASAVIKVDAASAPFNGAAAETFALATYEPFTATLGPALTVEPPAYSQRCPGDVWPVSVKVTNAGDLAAHDVEVLLTLPSSLTVAGGSNPASLGVIGDGLSSVAQWSLQATGRGWQSVNVHASSLSYGETFTKSAQFVVDVPYPPVAPVLSAPTNGTITCNALPTFDWEDVAGATGYRLEVADNIDFNNAVINTTTAGSQYTPVSALVNGTYYWRVRSTYLCGEGPWTAAVWSVTIIDTPATPALSSPPDNELTCDDTPAFDWSDVTMATSYNLQVDDNANFSSPVINANPTESTHTPGTPLALGSYYWQVRAANQCGGSAYTSSWRLTIIATPSTPSLSSPNDGEVTCDTTPTFNWSDMPMASGYSVQVDNNSGFSSPEINQNTSASDYTPGAALPAGTYYWRARATNKCGESSWSAARTVVILVPLAAPTLTAPADASSTCDTTPTFDWSDVSGATAYRIQADNNSDFGSPEINQRPGVSTYTPATALAAGTYYWRVQTTNQCGDGEWSSPVRSVTVVVPPGALSLSLPENGGEICDLTPTFDWTNATYASGYRLLVDDDPAFGSPAIDAAPAESTYTPETELAGGAYYWQARATNMCGDGPWSALWATTLLTPLPAPALQLPLADGIVCVETPEFDWSSVPKAAGYRIQIDSSPSFDSPAVDTLTTASDYVSEVTITLDLPYYWRVLSRTSCGEGDWSATRSFTRIAVPGQASQIAPPDGAVICNDMAPSFSWTSMSGATGYRIQLDNDPAFGSPLIETTTTAPEYMAPWPLSEDRYYWRVLAFNDCGNGTWSDVRILDVTIILNSPALVAPPDGSGACDDRPALDWADVAGATGYKIQVDDDPGFSSPQITTTIDSHYTPTTPLVPGLYYWRTLSSNQCGDGLWSAAWNVTVLSTPPVPGTPAPADGSRTCNSTPTFDWSDSAEATGYDIQVAEEPSFDTIVISATSTTSSYTPPLPLQTRIYYWRVRAIGFCGSGQWSAGGTGSPWSFEIITAPASPSLATPEDGAQVCESAIAFDWYGVGDATSYRLRVDDDPEFLSPAIDIGTSSTDYTPPTTLTLDTYYWQVNASNMCGAGSWSTARQFDVITTTIAPALQLPANGSSSCDDTPTFDWSDTAGATGYHIQIDDNSSFSSPVVISTTANSTYTPASPLPAGVLYWRVLTENQCGDGPWSVTWSVNILAPPSGPALLAPPNGSLTCDTTPTFDWADVGVLSYWLVADDDPDFGSPEVMTSVDGSAFTPPTALPVDRYFWRVRPLWACGAGAWSDTWTVIVGASPPVQQLPDDGSRTCNTTPVFDWSDVPGAASYRLQADNNLNFSTPELDVTSTGSTYTVTTPLDPWRYYWRVRSSNTCGDSVWSPLWQVTVVVPPAAPGWLAPPDASTTCDHTPDLDWPDVTTATAYRIQIDDDPDWASPEIDTVVTTSSFTPPSALAASVYNWRVRSIGECGEGNWSSTVTLEILDPPAVPTDPVPPSGSTTCDVTPAFDWADAARAIGYRIQVDDSPTFDTTEINTATVASAYTATTALPLGPYFWRVHSTNVCGESGWAGPWDLELITVPPAPILESPVDEGTACDSQPTFDWTDVIEATGYRLQVDDDPAFQSPAVDETSAVSSLIPGTALADGVYYWRVLSTNKCGQGAWTAAWTLVVGAPMPDLLSPPDGSRASSLTPTFDWSDVLGAFGYQIQADLDPDFGSPEIDAETIAPASVFTPLTPLPSGWYGWRVRTRTLCGYGLWSDPWQFQVPWRIHLPLVVRNH